MAQLDLARFMLATAFLAGALLVLPQAVQAQDDDRYFMLRDPFRRNTPFYSYPSRREEPAAPPAAIDAPPDRPAAIVYGSARDADKSRTTAATHYVLVIGDTLADQLALGLAEAFVTDRPEVAVVKKTKASSGLVRADFYDWPALVPGLIADEKPTTIVVMLGANDRQVLRDKTGPHEPRSSRWRELYGKRIDDMIGRVKEKGVPVFVVGMPSMRSQRLSDDMKYINEILRERAEKSGAYYVDIWDGFVNEKGEFITSGPALDGQTRRLRIGDGVHFSRAGGRKLAHYVERDLVRLIDQGPGRGRLLPRQGPETAPSGRPVAGPVLPLMQPVGPVGPLAGAERQSSAPVDGSTARVLVEGMPVEPIAGRADDFRWPPYTPAAAAPTPAQSIAIPEPPRVQPAAAETAAPIAPASSASPPTVAPATAKQNAKGKASKKGAPVPPPGRAGVPDIIRTR